MAENPADFIDVGGKGKKSLPHQIVVKIALPGDQRAAVQIEWEHAVADAVIRQEVVCIHSLDKVGVRHQIVESWRCEAGFAEEGAHLVFGVQPRPAADRLKRGQRRPRILVHAAAQILYAEPVSKHQKEYAVICKTGRHIPQESRDVRLRLYPIHGNDTIVTGIGCGGSVHRGVVFLKQGQKRDGIVPQQQRARSVNEGIPVQQRRTQMSEPGIFLLLLCSHLCIGPLTQRMI